MATADTNIDCSKQAALTWVTFIFIFCLGVRSPWRTTARTHRNSSLPSSDLQMHLVNPPWQPALYGKLNSCKAAQSEVCSTSKLPMQTTVACMLTQVRACSCLCMASFGGASVPFTDTLSGWCVTDAEHLTQTGAGVLNGKATGEPQSLEGRCCVHDA